MRWAACIEYEGTAYSGWQFQKHAPSIQEYVEAALSRVANEPISVCASGRTDSGVHALGQIIHFDTRAQRSARSWLLGSNRWLPYDIAPQWFVPVADNFHARFYAVARDYQYWLLDGAAPTALWRRRAWHVHQRLDETAMAQAAEYLLGEHDFSAFRAAGCQARSPMRDLQHLTIRRSGDWLYVNVRANAFLHHMVRNIVGTLVKVGQGRAEPEWVAQVLASRDRRKAGMTAPAWGLYMQHVHYPATVDLSGMSYDISTRQAQ